MTCSHHSAHKRAFFSRHVSSNTLIMLCKCTNTMCKPISQHLCCHWCAISISWGKFLQRLHPVAVVTNVASCSHGYPNHLPWGVTRGVARRLMFNSQLAELCSAYMCWFELFPMVAELAKLYLAYIFIGNYSLSLRVAPNSPSLLVFEDLLHRFLAKIKSSLDVHLCFPVWDSIHFYNILCLQGWDLIILHHLMRPVCLCKS